MTDQRRPLQNRVTPEGDIVAVTARGTMMGNRGGCFHNDDKTLGARRWANRQWICCVLEFKERRRALMQPGRYTELFFLDEATALSAGHRPCFECRRPDAVRFAELWTEVVLGVQGPRAPAPEMDMVLQGERAGRKGVKISHSADWAGLPDGTFVAVYDGAYLVWGGDLLQWRFEGYGERRSKPRQGSAVVLTPRSIVRILSAGYRPGVHVSAGSADSPIRS